MIEPNRDKDVLRDPLTAMRRLGAVNPNDLRAALAAALTAPVGDPRGLPVVDLLESAYRQPEGLPSTMRVQALRQLQASRPALVHVLRERLRAHAVLMQLFADALGSWDDSGLTEIAEGLLSCPPSAHRRPCVKALTVRLFRAGRHAELALLLPRLDLLEYLDLCSTESYWSGRLGKAAPPPAEVLKFLASRMNWHSSADERRAALLFCQQLPQRLSEADLAAMADTVRSIALRMDDPEIRAFLGELGARLPNNRRW